MPARPLRSLSPLLLMLLPLLAYSHAGAALASCLPPPPGLIAWWRGEGSGIDQAAARHAVPSAGVEFVFAAVDTGFRLAGTNAFLTVADDSSLDLSDGEKLTFAAWMKVDPGASDTRFVLDKRVLGGGSCTATGWAVYLSSGLLSVQLDGPAGCADYVSSSPDLRDNAFHFVAVTIDRDVAMGGKIYVDAVETFSFDCTATSGDLSNNAPLTIGHYGLSGPDYNFQGVLDEIDLYRRVLTPGEISALFAAGTDGKCRPSIFFAEDLNWTDPPEPADSPVRPETLPNCRARQSEFLSLLSSPPTVSFESIPIGALSQFAAGSRTVTVTGNVEVRSQPVETYHGTYPTDGALFLFQFSNPAFTLSFDSPIVAFGFMGTDIGDGGASLLLVVHRADGSDVNIQVPNSKSAPASNPNISGSALFFGLIDVDHPITGVTFQNPNNPLDGFGFDEVVVAGIENTGVPWSNESIATRVVAAPNPARGAVRFVVPGGGPATLRVRDVTGRTVWSTTCPGSEARWDGRDASGNRTPAGLYWVTSSSSGRGSGTPFVRLE